MKNLSGVWDPHIELLMKNLTGVGGMGGNFYPTSTGIFSHVGPSPFSAYAQFSEKLTILLPDAHTYVFVSGG